MSPSSKKSNPVVTDEAEEGSVEAARVDAIVEEGAAAPTATAPDAVPQTATTNVEYLPSTPPEAAPEDPPDTETIPPSADDTMLPTLTAPDAPPLTATTHVDPTTGGDEELEAAVAQMMADNARTGSGSADIHTDAEIEALVAELVVENRRGVGVEAEKASTDEASTDEASTDKASTDKATEGDEA